MIICLPVLIFCGRQNIRPKGNEVRGILGCHRYIVLLSG